MYAVDFMDNVIEPGVLIVYAVAHGSGSAKLTLAEVLEVKEGKYGPKLKVQPLQDSRGTRWSTYGKAEDGKMKSGVKKPSAVTLQRVSNVMVIT